MKIVFLGLFLASTAFSQTTPTETKDPEKQTAQKQEQKPGVENKFKTGPYNKNGQYIFFDRLEQEKREAEKEKEEQEEGQY